MKQVIGKAAFLFAGAMLSVVCAQANAAFVATTWGTAGVDLQESYTRLQATARGGGDEQVVRPLPDSGTVTAKWRPLGDWAYASISETYSLGLSGLRLDVTNIERAGPSLAVANGAWIFSVTEPTPTLATGFLHTQCCVYLNENSLIATLTDLTSNSSLFESRQEDFAAVGSYSLGGLVGLRASSFSGSLSNTLLPDHVYRLTYSLGVSRPGADSDNSLAVGQVALTALSAPVPEPATYTLMLAGLAMVVAVAHRRKAV